MDGKGARMQAGSGAEAHGGRTRTMPGKYTLGSWCSVTAANAERILDEEVIATRRMMVVRCLFEPGTVFEAQVHEQEQITIVESGVLQFKVNGTTIEVGPGRMISIFPGVLHESRVVGAEPVRALNIFQAAACAPSGARLGRAIQSTGAAPRSSS